VTNVRPALAVVCAITFYVTTGHGVDEPPVDGRDSLLRDTQQEAKSNLVVAELGGRHVDIWRPARSTTAPLIVFSHGFGACGRQSTFLTRALAEAGYFVVAPRHADARCEPFGQGALPAPVGPPQVWSDTTFRDRRDDIVAVLEALKQDPDYAGSIDWSKVGLMGHSLGGYTVLGLVGAWPGWRIPGVKAVVALSPTCPPFLKGAGTLGAISVPVQYQGGTLDSGITPFVKQTGGCYDETPAPAQFVEFRDADHFEWTDSGRIAHESIIFYARAFFDAWLEAKSADQFGIRRAGVTDLRIK
jgi:predicted dienelactone hydrolase